ncbi:MAG: hypothetical protein ACI9SG_001781 [Maribacter sp.]|jgi:hypothetical protein
MMRAKAKKQEQKHFSIKSFQQLWQLEEAIQELPKHTIAQLELSVLGKTAHGCVSNDKETQKAQKELKHYWKRSLGPTLNFGIFCNPELGTLFIVGSLASQFLNDMDGKALGEMRSGPYGILRGLGIPEKDATSCIKDLNEAYFLLILRGYDYELDSKEELL